jgi:hypothetical protein
MDVFNTFRRDADGYKPTITDMTEKGKRQRRTEKGEKSLVRVMRDGISTPKMY